MIAIVVGVGTLWLAGKWLSVLRDRDDWWDLSDLWAGAIAGVAMFGYQVTLFRYQPMRGGGLPHWVLALRQAVLFAYAVAVSLWIASVVIETETDYAIPDSLEPIETRVYKIHLGWFPFVEPRNNG